MQGIQPMVNGRAVDVGLGPVTEAFPYGVFPVGIHEFVSTSPECAAATSGFIAGLLGKVTRPDDTCIWISAGRTLFPPALVFFGISPDRIIFVDSRKPWDLSWMIEQALKCDALGTVVGEVTALDLAQSRRLQLAVEQSRVNCFLHRYRPGGVSAIASVCRWKIQPVPSTLQEGLPGVGFPIWEVTLEKVRNGQPGSWQIQWVEDRFRIVEALWSPWSVRTQTTDRDSSHYKVACEDIDHGQRHRPRSDHEKIRIHMVPAPDDRPAHQAVS